MGQGPRGPMAPNPNLGYDAGRAMSGNRPAFSSQDRRPSYVTPQGGTGRAFELRDDASSGRGSVRQTSKRPTSRFIGKKLTWNRTRMGKSPTSWESARTDDLDMTQKQLKKAAEKKKNNAIKVLRSEGMQGHKRFAIENLHDYYKQKADHGTEVELVSIQQNEKVIGKTRSGEIFERVSVEVIFSEQAPFGNSNYDDASSYYSSGSDRQPYAQQHDYESPSSPTAPYLPTAQGHQNANMRAFQQGAPKPSQQASAPYGASQGYEQAGPRPSAYPTNGPARGYDAAYPANGPSQGYDAAYAMPHAQGPSANNQRPEQNFSQSQRPWDPSKLSGEMKGSKTPATQRPSPVIEVGKESSKERPKEQSKWPSTTSKNAGNGIVDLGFAVDSDDEEQYEHKQGSGKARKPVVDVHQSNDRGQWNNKPNKKNEHAAKSTKKVYGWKDQGSSDSDSDISETFDHDSLDAGTPPSSRATFSSRGDYPRGDHTIKPEKSGFRKGGRRDSDRQQSRPEYEVHDRRRESFADKRRSGGYASAHGGGGILKDPYKRRSGESYRSRNTSDSERSRHSGRHERHRRDSHDRGNNHRIDRPYDRGYDSRNDSPMSGAERKRYSGSGRRRDSAGYYSDGRGSDPEGTRRSNQKVLARLNADLYSADHQLAAQREMDEMLEIGQKKGLLQAKLEELSAQQAYRKPMPRLDYAPSLGGVGAGRRRFRNKRLDHLSALMDDLDL